VAVAKKKPTAKKAASKKAAGKSSGTKKAAPQKPSAGKKAPAKTSPAKRSATKKSAVKAPSSKKASAKKVAPKKAASKRSGTKKAAAKQPAAKRPATKQPAGKRAATKPATKPAASAKKSARAAKKATTPRSSTRKAGSTPTMSSSTAKTDESVELPKPRFNKDGFGYTKDFDLSFVKQMHDALQEERVRLTGQAKRLEDEAHQLVEEAEMGDVQFDDEGGEGDTMVVERERDLALSAQAREAVEEIDSALGRIMAGTYGYSTVSGRPIPRERLEAIPWSTELVEEKVGGIGR